ncbi:MAG: type IV secretory system conjugative DNA transfer family protein [Nisaea sp.]|uniref:type IV secretory system conjugative DNA transfer family protein n=1 Tax=Nisaea sp. TaxID=2024842 RepID=UPI0032642114
MDDRHVVTIAGSRAGKGVSAIVPVLCTYPGSVVCIDPKGENAALTARRRGFGTSSVEGMGQEVYVLDPYEIADTDTLYRGTFDPLAGLGPDAPHTQEEVSLVVEALVVAGETKDVHWDDSARNLIEAIILHVVSWEELKAPRNLVTMYKLLRDGDTASRDAMLESVQKKHGEVPAWAEELSGFDILLMDMSRNDAFDGFISGAASGLRDLGKQERGSILSTARRNTKFLSASEMQACLSASDHELSLEELRTASRGITIYVVLPARLMAQHARWLRLLLNLTLSRLERMGPVKSKRPVLAILDEFPTLGYMETLENAVGYMAGFGLKIWAILQDLPQLKRHYEHGWETFLGNAGLLQFFGNSDSTTLTYISERLGKTELIRETETQSDTETTTITDISDFEKLQHATKASGLDGFLKSFQVDEKTETTSHSIARSASLNAAIHTTPLMTPDEISRFFARETNLQIAILPRARPMVLRRTSYFNDPFFTGKYEKMDGPVVKRDEAGPPAA